MSTSNVLEWLCLMCTSVIAMYVVNKYTKIETLAIDAPIRKKAKWDLSHIGRYDSRLGVSVRQWIYSIEVAVYKRNPNIDILDVLLLWNREANYDPDSIIYLNIQLAHSDFRDALLEAERNNTKPKFRIPEDYNYHNYPLSFINNDYIDQESLLNIVDNILGGNRFEYAGNILVF